MTERLNTPINLQVQRPVDYFLLGEGRRKEECGEGVNDMSEQRKAQPCSLMGKGAPLVSTRRKDPKDLEPEMSSLARSG